MQIKSLNTISFKSQFINANSSEPKGFQQEKSKLRQLTAKLVATHNLLSERELASNQKAEKADLISQIENLIMQIEYLEFSMKSKKGKN